ncbi:MAG: NFACT family protein [Nanoarchaeota archaeon]|nr:NFACT family protein [Nanoarchaeota archaeon]
MFLTEYKEEFPENPPGYCTFLRKRLKNARIKSLKQKSFERILEIIFEAKESELILIVELFSKGNLLLCEEDYTIISPFKSQNWKDRTIRGRVKYEFPPSQTNTPKLSDEDFLQKIAASNKDSIVKTLAIDFGFGGLYSEEICFAAKIDKTKKKFSKEELKRILKEAKELFSKKIKANICENELLPFELKILQTKKKIFYESFNQAIDEELTTNKITELKSEEKKHKEGKKDKLKLILEQQTEKINGLETSALENQRKGEFIYENYSVLKDILVQLNFAKEKFSWKEIKEKLKGHKIIKDVNEKERKVTVNL